MWDKAKYGHNHKKWHLRGWTGSAVELSIVPNFFSFDIHDQQSGRCNEKGSLTEIMWPPKPWAASAHSITALSWGYPTPVFLRVVHTEPEEKDGEASSHSSTAKLFFQCQFNSPGGVGRWGVRLITWSDAHFDDVSSSQNQLLHHFSSHHVPCLGTF